jgi:hypothetical protein
MRRRKRTVGDEKVKKITIRRLPKRNSFVVQYADGRRTETTFVEILGNATLYIDPSTKEPLIRTEANVNLGQNGACAICGGDADDQHAHA